MTIRLGGRHEISEGAVRNVAIDFSDDLDSGESLIGTVTVTDVNATGDLTISNKTVSSSTLTILNRSVASGKAVQFKVSGQQAGTTYILEVSVSTDSSPAQTLEYEIPLTGV